MRFSANKLTAIILDALFIGAAFSCAFFWRYGIEIPARQLTYLEILILPVVIITLAIFYFSRVYDIVWHYASVMDIFRIACANVISTLAIALLVYSVFQMPVARGVIALDGLLALALTAGARFVYRLFGKLRRHALFQKTMSKAILLVGAGDTGAAIARGILRGTMPNTRPIGFIDDKPNLKGKIIQGLRVLGTRNNLADVIAKHNVSQVIICMPAASRAVIRDVYEICQSAGVRCCTLPSVYQLISGEVSLEQIRDIQLGDILGRDPADVDVKNLSEYIRGKRVMVMGAGGSIGAELCRQVKQLQPASLIIVDQSESALFQIEQELKGRESGPLVIPVIADITNLNRINAIFKRYQPSLIFHAAAYKHVPMMEANLVEAVENNIIGTMNLCKVAIACGADKFVFISTDKAVEPASNMGKTKAVAEKVVGHFSNNKHTSFSVVRFGNVMDSSGSVVPIFKNQIATGGPVLVTHPDMKRYFMTIPESVHLVLRSCAIRDGGEIFLLDMGEQISILELAKNMIRLSGLEPGKDIAIEFCGVRPGEKLCEKLFWDDEDPIPTDSPSILATKNCRWDDSNFEQEIAQLESAISSGDEDSLRDIIDNICNSRGH